MARVSLAVRFICFISLLILATSLSLSVFMLAHEASEEDKEIRDRGISLVRGIAHNSELGVLTRNSQLLRELAAGAMQEVDVVSVTILDSDGGILLHEHRDETDRAGLQPISDIETVAIGAGIARIESFVAINSDEKEAYEFSYPVFTRRGSRENEEIGFLLEEAEAAEHRLEPIGLARLMLSLDRMQASTRELKWAFGLLTFIVISAAILLTVMLVRRMVAPLQRLAIATRRIAGGNLDEQVPESSNDEIGQLASSFNQMTSELRRSRCELEMHNAGLEDQVRKRTGELEEAQSQLVQAEKMGAVGLLVSGVAHELNNPLAGVVGYSQLLLGTGTDEKTRRGLEKINREAERCKKIVQNLQTFARKHKPQKDYVGVNGIIEGALELRSYQLKVDNIEVRKDLDPTLPKTMADFHQLQQVFLNLIINAHQAMISGKGEGFLILRTRRTEDRIVAEIEDSGPGISPDNINKIFDPFFTTKEVGQGTGLGLSICYGIVEEHKGRILARNSTDNGAVFMVELPIMQPEGSEIVATHPEPDISRETPETSNILVVDDELAIIDVLYQVLKADGHRVDTALNGAVALRKIQRERYDLIITDLKMPGMGGRELFERVREIDGDLSRRIVFSTGDVVSTETHDFLTDSGNSYLQKPFELDAIRKIVRLVLENNAG